MKEEIRPTNNGLIFVGFSIFESVLITLKALNLIQISWNIVLIPIYIWVSLNVIGLIVGLIIVYNETFK